MTIQQPDRTFIVLLVLVLVTLGLGMLLGAAWTKSGSTCSNATSDGGLTVVETCVRTWQP